MGGSWGYHAKWNKWGRKSQEPYDFTHMWDIKMNATNEQIRKTKKQKLIDTDNSMVNHRGKDGWGSSKM